MLRPGRIWYLSCQAYQKRLILVAKFLKLLNYVLSKCLLPYEAELAGEVNMRHWALGCCRASASDHIHLTLQRIAWMLTPDRLLLEYLEREMPVARVKTEQGPDMVRGANQHATKVHKSHPI